MRNCLVCAILEGTYCPRWHISSGSHTRQLHPKALATRMAGGHLQFDVHSTAVRCGIRCQGGARQD